VLTASREKYRDDIADFISEVGKIGGYLQQQFYQLYAVAFADVEEALLAGNEAFVNQLRKARGLAPLSLPKSDHVVGTEEIKPGVSLPPESRQL
jgi:hypothetical protein